MPNRQNPVDDASSADEEDNAYQGFAETAK